MLELKNELFCSQKPRWYHWLILAVLLFSTFIFRVHLLAIPLDCDEGEYAAMGNEILHGITPYAESYTMKFPGTAMMYAAIMSVFGETVSGIHTGLSLVIIITALFVFFLARKIMSPGASIVASLAFILMASSPGITGTALNPTHLIILFCLPSLLLLWRNYDAFAQDSFSFSEFLTVCASGVLFGLAILMKQHAIFFAIAAIPFFFLKGQKKSLRVFFRRSFFFFSGTLLPLFVTAFFLWRAGVWKSFYFWTGTYAYSYATFLSPAEGFDNFSRNLFYTMGPSLAVWTIGLIGFGYAIIRRTDLSLLLTAEWVAFCLMTIPGFYFRPHYFLVILPVIALGAGFVWDAICSINFPGRFRRRLFRGILLGAFLFIGIAEYWYYSVPSEDLSEQIYGGTRFAVAVGVGNYTNLHSSPNDKILIVGNEPEIFFYSHLRNATKFLYLYETIRSTVWTEKLQSEYLNDALREKPKFVVVAPPFNDDVLGPSAFSFFAKMNLFLKQYRLVRVFYPNGKNDLPAYFMPLPVVPGVLVFERVD